MRIVHLVTFTSAHLETVAQACHEVNRAYCLNMLGDDSQKPWEQTAGNLQASARLGVIACWKNPLGSAMDSHNNWLETKQLDGWKYGPIKDERLKVHPCMVPFDQLPEAQRLKDTLFVTTCINLFVSMGLLRYEHDDPADAKEEVDLPAAPMMPDQEPNPAPLGTGTRRPSAKAHR